MPARFHKMHGAGNDFVILDLREQTFPINASVAIQLADRNTGIGCDQVLVLRKAKSADQLASFEVWNADGSQAEQCGNGVRCLGLYLQMRSETPRGQFMLGGPAGSVKIRCLDDQMVQVDMGIPVFDPQNIPLNLQAVDGWYPVDLDGQRYQLGAASMGNPHALMLVDDIELTDVAYLGAQISHLAAFPNGCNAGFVQIQDQDNIYLRVYERGSQETLACGSGACAAMSILHRAGLVGNTIKVTQTGGILIIAWTGGNNPVIMTGPAAHVFEGNLV